MRVLVAYGSKMGGTEGLAEMIGAALRDLGHEVEVMSGREVADIEPYEAVIVGGALYYFVTWHRDARLFVGDHITPLRQRPVWFFSSGPLDDSAVEQHIPPIRPVRKLMERIGARGHATFGGRVEAGVGPGPVGDRRDPDHVRRWAEEISAQLTTVG